jgi:hypothetical protein
MRLLLLALVFASGACVVAPTNLCADGVRDGNETDVDCGGGCAPCAVGRLCALPADCGSGACVGHVCASVNTCADFALDGNETDVDCGGSCAPCGDGRACLGNSDCASGTCGGSGHCIEPTFTTVPAADVYQIAGGAGLAIVPGQTAGFGITANAAGGLWRLVWTGDGNVTSQYHEFYGSIYSDGSVSATQGCSDNSCTWDPGGYLSAPYAVSGGTRVDFDAFNVNNLDGIDITVSGGASGIGEPVYFDLYIDGQPNPQAVFFAIPTSAQPANPGAIPFGLVTR